MNNPDNLPVFVDSTLKTVAADDIDINKELAYENTLNLTIQQLLQSKNDNKKE